MVVFLPCRDGLKRCLPLQSGTSEHSGGATEADIDALVDKLGEIVIVLRGESGKRIKVGNN